ncbi:RNA polymerase sigma-70 factor [Kaistia algarum]|uniref:RNA polymerase sigma factor n=1 Tax=Kaistia algarum TaxID=2083279 RepID=UPI000CE79EBA|nr:sigma-70 family RNA polymerase sigma factor [Kaistia algarum]MCX5512211.1 sigma-70 family RNA polymerase sigma factor [Kaistia algarum]PPE80306.1 RNA polymerase sigma-70 factor [Kaistia algarum]
MDPIRAHDEAKVAVVRGRMGYRLVAGGHNAGLPHEETKGRVQPLSRKDDFGRDAVLRAEEALMQAIANGERDVFARLIGAEAPRLTRFVLAILSDLSEAEEIVQESLLRLWRQAPTWEPRARIGTYLHRVAYRLAIDRIRRRRPHVDIDDYDDLIEDEDESAAPDRNLDRLDEVRQVHEALDQLSDRQRAVIVLAHFQELGQAEAAAILGIGEHAYESLLARARRRLRTLLAENGEPAGEDWTKP